MRTSSLSCGAGPVAERHPCRRATREALLNGTAVALGAIEGALGSPARRNPAGDQQLKASAGRSQVGATDDHRHEKRIPGLKLDNPRQLALMHARQQHCDCRTPPQSRRVLGPAPIATASVRCATIFQNFAPRALSKSSRTHAAIGSSRTPSALLRRFCLSGRRRLWRCHR